MSFPRPCDTVCIDERDAILAHTIREEAVRHIKPGPVVAVMGSDHVLGVEKNWNEMGKLGGDSSGAAVEAAAAEVETLLAFPAAAVDSIGVRLAIMQRLLGLRCTESLVADANAALDADLDGGAFPCIPLHFNTNHFVPVKWAYGPLAKSFPPQPAPFALADRLACP